MDQKYVEDGESQPGIKTHWGKGSGGGANEDLSLMCMLISYGRMYL